MACFKKLEANFHVLQSVSWKTKNNFQLFTMICFERWQVAFHGSGWEGCGERKNKINRGCIHECAALPVAVAIKDVSRTETPFFIFLLCDTQNPQMNFACLNFPKNSLRQNALFSVRLSALYKNSYGTNPCWTRNQIAEFGCLETWKGHLSAGCLPVRFCAFYKAIKNILMLDQKSATESSCLETPKTHSNYSMSVGLLLCLLQKIERISQMFCFRSFATQTGISGILDCIKPRRGESAFLALSLHYSSETPKLSEQLLMWRVWNKEYDNWMACSSSFLLLSIKRISGILHASERRLSLPFFPNLQVNLFMCLPKSLALPDIHKILQHSTMISKTAGAVLKDLSVVLCAVLASAFPYNILGILSTKLH